MPIEIINTKPFGKLIDWSPPPGTDLAVMTVIVPGVGRVLKRLVLPHQTYVETAQWCLKHTLDCQEFEIIPVRTADIVTITHRELMEAMERETANAALARMPWGVRVGEPA